MNALTDTEVKIYNNISNEKSPDVDLGTEIQGIITELHGLVNKARSATPVNAVNPHVYLRISGDVKHGETVTLGADTFEFLGQVPPGVPTEGFLPVPLGDRMVKASGVLTIATKPTSGDTMTIGTTVYIFVPVGTANAPGEVSIGADVAGARVNIVAAINGTDGHNIAHPDVVAGNFAGTDSAITAKLYGSDGNAIATTETFTATGNVFAAETLEDGEDCSAADALSRFPDLIAILNTQGLTWMPDDVNSIDVIAPAGAAGNSLEVSTTAANVDFFNDESFYAGVDGTIGVAGDLAYDGTNLYVCIATNTIQGKNWRKIQLSALS